MVLSFDAWKGAKVNPTIHAVSVLPVKAGPKAEPVSSLLTGTLVHPDRKGNIGQLKYSDNGKKLFVSGYPSGVVQIFDVAVKKELVRIETPKGWRGTDQYALLTPDWKTLYVADENREKSVKVEIDGKQDIRLVHSGQLLVWDATTGKPLDSLLAEKDHGLLRATLSPLGDRMVVIEQATYLFKAERDNETRVKFAIDLKTGRKTRLTGAGNLHRFLPDGKTGLFALNDYRAKTSTLQRIELSAGKVLASLESPVKGLMMSVAAVSPDGKLVAISLGGKAGATPTTLFLDTETLKTVATLTGNTEDDDYGWQIGTFTPDGKLFLASSRRGAIRAWDVATKTVTRTLVPGAREYGRQEVSQNGKWLAVAWMPKWDEDQTSSLEPDPTDMPQPRVTLYDLTDEKAKPVTLIAPHGFIGGLTFRPDGKQLAFGSSGGVHLFDLSALGK